MDEEWHPITAGEYDALPGKEGGGFMGCVFKYDDVGDIVARRSFDEHDPKPRWEYHLCVPTPTED